MKNLKLKLVLLAILSNSVVLATSQNDNENNKPNSPHTPQHLTRKKLIEELPTHDLSIYHSNWPYTATIAKIYLAHKREKEVCVREIHIPISINPNAAWSPDTVSYDIKNTLNNQAILILINSKLKAYCVYKRSREHFKIADYDTKKLLEGNGISSEKFKIIVGDEEPIFESCWAQQDIPKECPIIFDSQISVEEIKRIIEKILSENKEIPTTQN